jgi:signal transduction histidine kinase
MMALADNARDSLSQAAHELRLPVSHIKGFVSTLRRRDAKVDDETRDDFLGEIEHEIDRVSELIDGLLEESRAGDRRQSRIPRRATRPASLVEGGLDRVRRLLQGRCVEVNIARDLPLVEVDSPAIERVIANLVQNALKYARADSHIRLSAQADDDALELRVEDDGPGIPSCDRRRIFARSYRGRRAKASSQTGYGLGLTICLSIVTAHGGRIWADSRPGGGTRFIVVLPLLAPSGAAKIRLTTDRAANAETVR